jgi:hypothetical protein
MTSQLNSTFLLIKAPTDEETFKKPYGLAPFAPLLNVIYKKQFINNEDGVSPYKP